MVIVPADMIVPVNEAVPPIPTAPSTCQNTREACAALMSTMWLSAAVFNAAPTWKMNTAFGSPCASSVIVPDNANAATV